jgi:hypothetical protein
VRADNLAVRSRKWHSPLPVTFRNPGLVPFSGSELTRAGPTRAVMLEDDRRAVLSSDSGRGMARYVPTSSGGIYAALWTIPASGNFAFPVAGSYPISSACLEWAPQRRSAPESPCNSRPRARQRTMGAPYLVKRARREWHKAPGIARLRDDACSRQFLHRRARCLSTTGHKDVDGLDGHPGRWDSDLMTQAAKKLLEEFDTVQVGDRAEVLAELLRRVALAPHNLPDLEDLVAAADQIFLELDRREQSR